jgi:hypothetical protein
MKTITLGRDAQNQPIRHPAYQKFATEFGFHPSLCVLGAGNQKGSVENLVQYVKGNLLLGQRFHDDLDLEQEQDAWLHSVNHVRTSQATEQIPAALLAEECRHFAPLPAVAQDYGFFDSVLVNRESPVHIAANRYSVPAHLVGHTLTARIHAERIELFDGRERVATHRRHLGRNVRVIVPEHYEAVFVRKPRARVMVYRDWLVGLSPTIADYIAQVCHKHYAVLCPGSRSDRVHGGGGTGSRASSRWRRLCACLAPCATACQASTDAGGKPTNGVAGGATAGNGRTSVESL